MHIPKLLAMISVATLGAGALSVHAQRPDSDMQAIAREQMRQALLKMDATNTAPAATPKPVKKVATPPPAQPTMVIVPPAPKPVPPPVAVAPPPAPPMRAVPPPAVVVTPAPTPAAQPKVVSVPEQPKPVVVAKPKKAEFSEFSPIAEAPGTQNPPVVLVIPGQQSPMIPSGNSLKHSDERKARDEVRKTLGETTPKANIDAKFPVEAKMGTETVTATAHPTPAPGSKEDRLAELLEMYKADKISPAEYHDQRAKIVAEP